MRDCGSCKFCWRDDSVGERECTVEALMSEEEMVTYFENMSDNCPNYLPEWYGRDYIQ